MAAEDTSGQRPGPVVLRIKLRYDDVDTMVQRFAANVGKSGLFLPTKSLQPVGADVKFELRLADDTPVLVGLGRVKEARGPDPAAPRAAFGMAIELMRVTRESRDLILRMLERRRALGLAELALPSAADVDAARRTEAEAGVRDAQTGPVTVTQPTAAPVPLPPVKSRESEPLMTAPRKSSGSIAVAKVHVVEPLAPEAPRKRRPGIGELIEIASGPVAMVAMPGLDEDVDVGAVLVRARALAGGSVDAELEAILDSAAAPIEIGVEAASAELARQLGGKAVRRDRSARWAPPPPSVPVTVIAEPAVAEPAAPEPIFEVSSEPTPVEAMPDAATRIVAGVAPFAIAPLVDPEDDDLEDARGHAIPSSGVMIDDDGDAADLEDQILGAAAPLEVEPEQIADEIHQLDDMDLEEVEHTQLGEMPGEGADPSLDAAGLDEQLAAAEAEADADLGFTADAPLDDGPDLGLPNAGIPDEDAEEEVEDFEILAEADAEDADLMFAAPPSGIHTMPAEVPYAAPAEAAPAEYEPFANDPDPEPESTPDPDPRSSREFDYEERLDLGEESDLYAAAPDASDPGAAFPDEPHVQAHVYSDAPFDHVPTSRAFPPPAPAAAEPAMFDDVHAQFRSPGMFDESDVIDTRGLLPDDDGVPVRAQPAPRARPAGDEDFDLETALEALDVDLDDLSIPHAATELPRSDGTPRPTPVPAIRPPSQSRPPTSRAASHRGLPRASSADDGILIDFDDDENE